MPTAPSIVPDTQRPETGLGEFIYGPFAVLDDSSTYSGAEGAAIYFLTPKGMEQLENSNDMKSVDGDEVGHLTISDLLDAYNKVHGTDL